MELELMNALIPMYYESMLQEELKRLGHPLPSRVVPPDFKVPENTGIRLPIKRHDSSTYWIGTIRQYGGFYAFSDLPAMSNIDTTIHSLARSLSDKLKQDYFILMPSWSRVIIKSWGGDPWDGNYNTVGCKVYAVGRWKLRGNASPEVAATHLHKPRL